MKAEENRPEEWHFFCHHRKLDRMAREWVDEVCGDVFGTRFVGMVATNTMAQAAMQAGSDSGDAHAQLCGTLHGQAVPAAFTEVGGGRPVVKVTACATDAVRYATASAAGDGRVLYAQGCYVGGDVDMASSSSASRWDNTQDGDIDAQPLPYVATDTPLVSPAVALREARCLRHLVLRVLAGKLLGWPVKVLVIELVLANNGLTMRREFLNRLGDVCAKLDVALVLDETMTFGRTYGVTMNAGRCSLLACDAMDLAVALNARYIVSGKVGGIGLVWGRPGTDTNCIEPGRGTSTSVGPLRIHFATAVFSRLLAMAADCAIARKRTAIEGALRVSASTTSSTANHATWGVGLLLFSEVLPATARTDVNTPGRLLPTLAVAEAGTPPHFPLKRSGVTLARLESGIASRTDARLESGGGKAGADQLYWAAAAAAHELHGKQGGKVHLRHQLEARWRELAPDTRELPRAVSTALAGMIVVDVGKRRSAGDSREYIVDVGAVAETAAMVQHAVAAAAASTSVEEARRPSILIDRFYQSNHSSLTCQTDSLRLVAEPAYVFPQNVEHRWRQKSAAACAGAESGAAVGCSGSTSQTLQP